MFKKALILDHTIFLSMEALKLRQFNSTFLNGTMYFFMTLLPTLRRIQRPTTQGRSSYAKYEKSRKIETYSNNHLQRIH